MDHHEPIAAPGLKIATAWAAFGITSWTDAAGFLAAVYSAILIGEWCWKRFARAAVVRWWTK